MSTHRAKSSRQRLTAAQILKKPAAEPALGVHLYEVTNQLAFSSPITAVSGRHGDKVYHVRRGNTYIRRYVSPPPPTGERQLDHQDRMRLVMPSWSTLPADIRQAWLDYSLRHFGEHQPGKKRGNLGQNLYTQAQLNRLAFGETLSAEAPALPPPPRIIQVVEVPAPAGQLAWRIDHGLKLPNGYRVEVRMTPGTINKPLDRHLVRAGQTTAGSFFPLQASGAVYLLDQPLHSPAPGERYGLQMKLITPEGVEGVALILDLTRKKPGELPAGMAAIATSDQQPLQSVDSVLRAVNRATAADGALARNSLMMQELVLHGVPDG